MRQQCCCVVQLLLLPWCVVGFQGLPPPMRPRMTRMRATADSLTEAAEALVLNSQDAITVGLSGFAGLTAVGFSILYFLNFGVEDVPAAPKPRMSLEDVQVNYDDGLIIPGGTALPDSQETDVQGTALDAIAAREQKKTERYRVEDMTKVSDPE